MAGGSPAKAPEQDGHGKCLNDVRERVTAMTDAALVQLNGAHMGDELTWEPLAAATACGPAASDEEVRDKIVAVLEWAQHLVTERSATLAQTGHSVFQPTPDDPAYVLMIDEVDEVVASVPGSGAILEFLASKQRKSAVCLIVASQRATQKQTGGGMVRANLSQVVIGNTNRATESRHATGAEAEIPDISEYSRAGRATSRSGTRRPRRSRHEGARSCSGCPRTSWPTASASSMPARAPAVPCPARTWPPPLPGVMPPESVFPGTMTPERLRRA